MDETLIQDSEIELEGFITFYKFENEANGYRIASFKIDDITYQLDKNGENGSCLHSGYNSYSRKVWDCKTFSNYNGAGVIFSRISPDGEQGFPGNLEIQVVYTITDNNTFSIKIKAITDKKTYVNLTNHSYFNLKGINGINIDDLYLKINSDKIVETDEKNLPTGRILNIKNSSYDFTEYKNIGQAIKDNNSNFDTCYYFENS